MISYRFVPISSQKGVLFFETPGNFSFTMSTMCSFSLFNIFCFVQ